ncbi:hypothetical protein V3C99_003018 [Haemonchus contortus]|uniref:Tyrosine-protein kinase n=1 Tax=Haemonchus contortus TaxID=6289 RepID=A0A7I4Y9E2_HAECO
MEMLSPVGFEDPLTDKTLIDRTFLHGYSYYHGMIPIEDIPDLLERDGDFILRKELISDGLLIAAISVRCGDVVKHFVINQSPQGDFYIEGVHARTVEELIQKHLQGGEPLSKASQAILRRPIPRQDWMLNHEDIVIKESVGKHHSVEEFVGELIQNNITRPAFLKTIGKSCTREARSQLMREARLLRSLRHENVGETYGIALHYSPIILVMEYFSLSLITYLQRNAGHVPLKEKRRFVCEAAAGLSYLAQSNCIHRDIAARNCKLTDSLQVKISGLSFCENLDEPSNKPTMQIAVKWQAPEVLKDGQYSLKSDVWSFGVLMWEVYNDGIEPYPGMSPSAVKQAILETEYRMPIPEDCPELLAKIMTSCWDSFSRKRPCMQAIHLVIRDC